MRPGVRKLLATLGVCLVFALGMAAGAALTLRIVRHRAASLLTRQGSDLATERLARHLADRLRCDPAQREKVVSILRSAHGELWEVRRETVPRVREVYGRAVAEVRGILRSEQVKTLDEIAARQSAALHLDDGVAAAPTPAAHAP